MILVTAKRNLRQAPLERRKLSHVLLVIPPASHASQAHTKSCDMISGV